MANYDLSSLRHVFSGAAPLGAELETAAQQRFPHVCIKQGYGMTELSPISHVSPSDKKLIRAGAAVLGMLGVRAHAQLQAASAR